MSGIKAAPLAERLQQHFKVTDSGCLEWTSHTVKGYGRICFNGKQVLTHRLAWERANGPIPPGLNVLHHCDNPPCGQTDPTEGYPDGHLFLGTPADNSADMAAKGRASNSNKVKTHCLHGHPFNSANTYARRNGQRACRICKNADKVKYRSNQRLSKARLTHEGEAA